MLVPHPWQSGAAASNAWGKQTIIIIIASMPSTPRPTGKQAMAVDPQQRYQPFSRTQKPARHPNQANSVSVQPQNTNYRPAACAITQRKPTQIGFHMCTVVCGWLTVEPNAWLVT
jgi:hypothetical protein